MLRVALIEHSEEMRKRLVGLLEETAGIEIIGCAADGGEGLRMLSTERPDAVFLDVALPGRGGAKLLREIRRSLPEIMIVALSDESVPQYRSRCIELGANFFVDRSSEFERILSVVEDLLRAGAEPRPQPVMLALSAYRKSDIAIETAVTHAERSGALLAVVYVIDINLNRYIPGCDLGSSQYLYEKCERKILRELYDEARRIIGEIEEKAEAAGVKTKTYLFRGRFGQECVRLEKVLRPEIVVTTRSDRPDWLRKVFGSPVDFLIKNANCRVIEAPGIKQKAANRDFPNYAG